MTGAGTNHRGRDEASFENGRKFELLFQQRLQQKRRRRHPVPALAIHDLTDDIWGDSCLKCRLTDSGIDCRHGYTEKGPERV